MCAVSLWHLNFTLLSLLISFSNLSLSVFALCWSSLGTPHFLLTLVPNLTSPMSLLDQPHWGISWIWESTAHLTLPPTPLHQSAICICSFMLTLSLSSFLPQKTKKQNGDLAPSPCLCLGSWVRVFTHTFSSYFPLTPSHPDIPMTSLLESQP